MLKNFLCLFMFTIFNLQAFADDIILKCMYDTNNNEQTYTFKILKGQIYISDSQANLYPLKFLKGEEFISFGFTRIEENITLVYTIDLNTGFSYVKAGTVTSNKTIFEYTGFCYNPQNMPLFNINNIN